jgi:hypothetical protein
MALSKAARTEARICCLISAGSSMSPSSRGSTPALGARARGEGVTTASIVAAVGWLSAACS